ncbi:chemotaxis protein CheW [Legionella sp. 29fVS95]|uniref:chemotaxis protein CheW n=1 Tax=Legionella sp. 29fVS95 TaxID=3402813 RepID=UPI003AF9B282
MIEQVVVFLINEYQFGLPLKSVDRVVQVVEITPLPSLPPSILGIINLQGQIMPVLNIRLYFYLPEHQINLSDKLIIITQNQKSTAFLVDKVVGVIEYDKNDFIDLEPIFPGIEYVRQVLKGQDGLILLLHDLDKLLPIDEAKPLQEAIAHADRK